MAAPTAAGMPIEIPAKKIANTMLPQLSAQPAAELTSSPTSRNTIPATATYASHLIRSRSSWEARR